MNGKGGVGWGGGLSGGFLIRDDEVHPEQEEDSHWHQTKQTNKQQLTTHKTPPASHTQTETDTQTHLPAGPPDR